VNPEERKIGLTLLEVTEAAPRQPKSAETASTEEVSSDDAEPTEEG